MKESEPINIKSMGKRRGKKSSRGKANYKSILEESMSKGQGMGTERKWREHV